MKNSKAGKESMSYGRQTSYASRRILAAWFVLVLIGLGGCKFSREQQSAPPSLEVRSGEVDVSLHPVPAFISMHAAGLTLPFFQAVPLAKGVFFAPKGGIGVALAGRPVPAKAAVAAHWPDGSAQWVSIAGAWPADMPLTESSAVRLCPAGRVPAAPPQFDVRAHGAGIAIFDAAGKRLATMRPEIAALRITRPKAPDSRKPEDLDTVVQYAWAEKCAQLNPEAGPFALDPCMTEFLVEEETPASILYRVRGNGGEKAPGCDLEWQLRVRVFRHTPVIRFQMTWFFHWDPAAVALASAEWVTTFDQPVRSAGGAGRVFALSDGPVSLSSLPAGRSRVTHGGKTVLDAEWPDPKLHAWVVETDAGAIGIGLPDFTRLGPNRLSLAAGGIENASWDGRSGLALDLRSTIAPDEFGIIECDLASKAEGVARTVEMVWAVRSNAKAAGDMARAETVRDGLWFANRADMIRSQALGPWREGAFERNRAALVATLSAQIHWIMASRDYWRWNGFINFGDIRTNWSREGYKDKQNQILRVHPMMWGMGGRYGWRHGSGEPYRGFLTYGLWTEDREMLLFAFDYARHVADVDVVHGRFGQPLHGNDGGMHRRNKNHWSGDVQMQYTPSRGLYLAKWLTGFERLDESLVEIRDFATRNPVSVFAASSWLSRYTETGNPADLAVAEKLLSQTVTMWENLNRKSKEYGKLRGLAALHAGNFRLSLDWWPVQVEFHRATDDPVYLKVLAERASSCAKGISDLSGLYPLAYLMSQGYTAEQLGAQKVKKMNGQLNSWILRFGETPPRDQWNYEILVQKRAVGQSSIVSLCGAFAPVVLSWFDTGGEAE